jgi:hypothetical protein
MHLLTIIVLCFKQIELFTRRRKPLVECGVPRRFVVTAKTAHRENWSSGDSAPSRSITLIVMNACLEC